MGLRPPPRPRHARAAGRALGAGGPGDPVAPSPVRCRARPRDRRHGRRRLGAPAAQGHHHGGALPRPHHALHGRQRHPLRLRGGAARGGGPCGSTACTGGPCSVAARRGGERAGVGVGGGGARARAWGRYCACIRVGTHRSRSRRWPHFRYRLPHRPRFREARHARDEPHHGRAGLPRPEARPRKRRLLLQEALLQFRDAPHAL